MCLARGRPQLSANVPGKGFSPTVVDLGKGSQQHPANGNRRPQVQDREGLIPNRDHKNLKAEGFFCSLDVLYGGRGISKLQFLIKTEINFCFIFFFLL